MILFEILILFFIIQFCNWNRYNFFRVVQVQLSQTLIFFLPFCKREKLQLMNRAVFSKEECHLYSNLEV